MRKLPAISAERPRTMDDDPVVKGILKAISQKRLRPGLKLGEARLASAFNTTRIHVRQALAHLASPLFDLFLAKRWGVPMQQRDDIAL